VKDPVFSELKEFVLTEAEVAQKRTVYESETASEGDSDSTESTTLSVGATTKTTPTKQKAKNASAATTTGSTSSANDGGMEDLSKKFEAMMLMLESLMTLQRTSPATLAAKAEAAQQPRKLRCVWCDSQEHSRMACSELSTMLRGGQLRLNEQGRVINAVTGEEIPAMFGRGGMKTIWKPAVQNTSATVSQITLEGDVPLATIGNEGSVCLVTIHDGGRETYEYMDAEVEEKRKREERDQRQVRQRTDAGPEPGGSGGGLQGVGSGPALAGVQPTPQQLGIPVPRTVPERPLYRNTTTVSEKVDIGDIVDKILRREVVLTIEEVLASSPEVRGQVVDALRNRRQTLEGPRPFKPRVSTVSVNHVGLGPLYACASPRVRTTLENILAVDALIDDGSEISIMPRRVFERLNIPIDTEINWRINTYETVRAEADGRGLMEVCHSVNVSVGGVAVDIPIFVVEDANSDLLLGRPWERFVQAQSDNRADGSLWICIRTPDGRRCAQFCAVKADHERNRSFAKFPDEQAVGTEWGKV
jgi:hypothetical protein